MPWERGKDPYRQRERRPPSATAHPGVINGDYRANKDLEENHLCHCGLRAGAVLFQSFTMLSVAWRHSEGEAQPRAQLPKVFNRRRALGDALPLITSSSDRRSPNDFVRLGRVLAPILAVAMG